MPRRTVSERVKGRRGGRLGAGGYTVDVTKPAPAGDEGAMTVPLVWCAAPRGSSSL